MQKGIELIAKKFLEKIKNKEVCVISHFDTDGITSAAIMVKALKRLDKKFAVKIVKNLEEQDIYDLPKNKVILFLDLASNSLEHISKSKLEDVFIIDHHELSQKIPLGIQIINPQLHNKEQISTSGLAYLFSKHLVHETKDLAKLAIIGMIGDQLEKSVDKINNQILIEGEIIKKRGILLYPSTRPLNRVLEFSSNPFIPGVTGNARGAIKLLRELNLNTKNGRYPNLIELNQEEMSKLITAVLLRNPKNHPQENLVGDIFLVKLYNKLEDAREISAMINACSRLDKPDTAIQLCLEIPNARKKAESLHAKQKQNILSALNFASKVEKIEGKGFVIINAKSNIKDTIIGTIASILSNSQIYEEGTIIITMAYNDVGKIKVSARTVGKQGRNLRALFKEVISKTGGEFGGHEFAAGCLIDKAKEQEFLKQLQKSLEIELVKI